MLVYVFVLVTLIHVITSIEMMTSTHILPSIVSQVFNTLDWHYGMIGLLDVVYFLMLVGLLATWPPWTWPFFIAVSLLAFWPWISLLNAGLALDSKNEPLERRIATYFPQHTILEKEWEMIRGESDVLIGTINAQCMRDVYPRVNALDTGSKATCWKWYVMKDFNGVNENAQKYMPRTLALLESMPNVVSASISILEPHTSLQPHVGYYKGLLRYHLGLRIPPGNVLTVDGHEYEWKDGQGVLFDDMYTHSVRNTSNERRVVLYLDIARNDLSPPLAAINSLVLRHVTSALASADRRRHAEMKRK